MPVPREIPRELAYPELVWPTILAIREKGGSASIEEIEDGVARLMNLSEDVLAAPHTQGSRTELQYRLAWVRTYLKKNRRHQQQRTGRLVPDGYWRPTD
ncbi:MAG: winged helix-turn-helix domain-containing protein [Hyphomonadaceae bacterium]